HPSFRTTPPHRARRASGPTLCDDAARWTAAEVSHVTSRTEGAAAQWMRHTDGSLHADYEGDALTLQRNDEGLVQLTTATANTPLFDVLVQSLTPELADVLAAL